jgi:hypothetical protein
MWSDEARSPEETRAFCQGKLDLLLEGLFVAHPELEEMWPAEAVEDALIFCGFHVVDEPLPRHQYAVCDMAQRLVVVNSEMSRFVHKWSNLTALRRGKLAHELGHVVLHRDDISRRVFRSYQDEERFVDTRAYQQENEADLFARLYLMPQESLLRERECEMLRSAIEGETTLKRATVESLISRLATRYKVNPPLMKDRLADLGWLYPTARGNSWKDDLRLRRPTIRDYDC